MEIDRQACVENAVAWATRRLGMTSYASRCLAFVEDAYERSNQLEVFAGDFAGESAELYGVRDNTGVPPIGAFVFYDTSGELFGRRQNWGHVGLCVGDGRVVHAWDRVRNDHYLEVENLTGPPGWDAPRWIGWAPVERILQGCLPKDWTATGDPAAAARRMAAARFGAGAVPSLRLRMRQALPEAMRARDKAAVSALRATLAALDNAEAVPLGEVGAQASAVEESPAGAGATEAARRELSERGVADIVRAEATERLAAAARLTAPAHADRVARLRAEAAVLLRFLDGHRGTAQ